MVPGPYVGTTRGFDAAPLEQTAGCIDVLLVTLLTELLPDLERVRWMTNVKNRKGGHRERDRLRSLAGVCLYVEGGGVLVDGQKKHVLCPQSARAYNLFLQCAILYHLLAFTQL